MSLPRYQLYKKLAEVGEVPSHWRVVPLKRIISRIDSGTSVNAVDEPAAEGRAGVLKTSCVYTGTFDPAQNKAVVEEELSRLTCPLRGGTLIVSRMNTAELIGAAGVVKIAPDQLYLPDRLWQVSFHDAIPEFVHFWTMTPLYRDQIQAVCTGTSASMKNIGQGEFGSVTFVAPPPEEQVLISDFLSEQLTKIDALISDQHHLIALLNEKRHAVISHAVTKGLNPDAPMRDSGVEWLGEVPAHWRVLPLKRIVAEPITDGPHETPIFLDEGVPFVSAEAVSQGSIDFSRIRGYISEADNLRYSRKYSPKLQDIFLVKSGATTGVTAMVQDRTDFNIWSPLAVVRCGPEAHPPFVLQFMRSRHFLDGISLNWSFGTQQNIGMGVLQELVCPVPPLPEQRAIAHHLATEAATTQTLVAEAKSAIDLLNERRTALISAAVTGQIDVRGLASVEVA